ncbi:MAG: TetR/AcrR family transcriptional regulator [bacterium]|nr:TetR/AcrR family transcriptional regulator [bacterium]
MGIKERRQRERQARLDAVLGATRDLVRERGFAGATTRSIAERCEFSEATLFHYFKSKDEIFTSLLFEGIDFMARGLDEIQALDVPRRQRLARLWSFFGEVRREHPEYIQVFGYLAHPQATAAVTDEVKAQVVRRTGDNLRRLASFFEDPTSKSDGRLAADLFWAAFVGLMVLRDSRISLGAAAHPTETELEAALGVLLGGMAGRQSQDKDS